MPHVDDDGFSVVVDCWVQLSTTTRSLLLVEIMFALLGTAFYYY